MSVDQPFNIYREQLSSLNHGLALWDPKPVENLHLRPGHVSIGDVGYLDNGAFMRMFNVTLPWDDPSNKLLGNPEKYEHIKLSLSRDFRYNEIREGEHYTPHVSKVDNLGADRHEDSIGQMYLCSAQDRGALLSLPHEGQRKDVIPIKVFENYIKDNVDYWFRWSKKMNLPVEHMEDLILVTGCTLVPSWAAAVFDGQSVGSDAPTISLEARKVNGGGAQFFWRNIRGNVEYHNSRFKQNIQKPLPQNQCVFIRGFRAKRTFFRTRSMRAAAEPLPDDPDDDREDEIQVTRIPDCSKYRDPLVGILDYIILKCNEDITATEDIIAISHDDDLQLIKDVETLTADAIEKFLLGKQMPLIVENGSAILRDPADNERYEPPVPYEKKKGRPVHGHSQAPSDSGPDFNMAPADPARPENSRWELGEILETSTVQTRRDCIMAVDSASSPLIHQNHGTFLSSHFDQSMDHLPPHSVNHLPLQPFDGDNMDVTDHPFYDMFLHPPPPPPQPQQQPSSPHQSFRLTTTHAALLHGSSSEPVYSGMFSRDSVPSFHSQSPGPYDMMGGMSSRLSSGKFTPSDPSGVLPFFAGPANDIKQDFSDLTSDLRLPTISPTKFESDTGMHDDFSLEVDPQPNFGGSATLPPFSDRMPRFPSDGFLGQPQLQGHPSELLCSVPPQATHNRFDGGTPCDETSNYIIPSPQNDLALRIPSVEDTMMGQMGASSDLHTFIRPYIDQYMRTSNRLAFGERTVIVMSSKVAQKSYGTEKRFLCPPPTAVLIGNSWWSDVARRGDESKPIPPRVAVSISGEAPVQEGNIEWSAATGKPFDVSDPPTGTTYIGRCAGKQLFIPDVDEKKIKALVKVTASTGENESERVIAVFPSRPIKVISKPSKRRQSSKLLELCINHGSTISLFHRLRSQTVSTKYLCVSGSGSSFKGSDGAPLMGIDQRNRASTPSFIAKTSSWDPFVMYIVDAEKLAGGMDAPPPPPPYPDYPSPPPNAIPFMNNGTPIPIYYNQTVVLQCLTSGVVSPVLTIRKVDRQNTVVGGGAQEGSKGVGEQYCAPGEVCGDPVSQLHKVAFEVFEPGKGTPGSGSPGQTGAFLSCMGEKVNTYRPVDGRQWQSGMDGPRRPDSPVVPSSPIISTPASNGSGNDYFGSGPSAAALSRPASPVLNPLEFPSSDGGRVKKQKYSSSAGGLSKSGASSRPRRRSTSASSAGSVSGASSGALWQVDIGEMSVWTIVGTDQVRYNFYVPPVLFDSQDTPQTGSYPVPSKPVTPFPSVVKYLPPDRESEAPNRHGTRAKPSARTSKLLKLYGENFSKSDPVSVFFGSTPSPFVEVRCSEVLGCLPPEHQMTKRQPIILVRGDGVVFPSSVMYP